MLLLRLVAAATLIAAPTPIALAGGEHWIADFDKAVQVAKQSNRDLLVDFTGSDWCGWCKRLDAEVFKHDEFLKAAEKSFVLVSLDFPRAEEIKAKVPNPQRNEELQEKYAVQGFPTILLMTVDGDVYGRTGYRPGGPSEYVKHLDELRGDGKKSLQDAKTLATQYEAAQGDEKAKLLDQAIDKLAELDGDSPVVKKLAPIARDAFKVDAQNQAGRKLRATKALLGVGELDPELEKAVDELDAKNEHGLQEKLVEARCMRVGGIEDLKGAVASIERVDQLGIKDKELQKRLYANAAFWSHRHLENPDAAKKWAEKLKAVAGEDENFKELIDQILG